MRAVLTTRRSLLKAGAAAAAGALLGGRPWAPAAARAASEVPPELRRSSYAGLVGTSFAVVGAGVALTLRSVDDVAGAGSNRDLAGSDDAFVLTFSGPQAGGPAQGVHALRHGALGNFELFLSPVGSPADASYAVVVDRSVRLAEAHDAAPAPPAPAIGHPDAAAAAGAAAAGAAPAKHLRRFLRRAVIRRAGLRRAAGGLRADLVLRPGAHVRRMRVRLIRHGRTLAAAQHTVDGAEQVALTLRPARRPAPGEYDLLITTVDAHGVATAQQSRVTLR
jgi:hypothetical protein